MSAGNFVFVVKYKEDVIFAHEIPSESSTLYQWTVYKILSKLSIVRAWYGALPKYRHYRDALNLTVLEHADAESIKRQVVPVSENEPMLVKLVYDLQRSVEGTKAYWNQRRGDELRGYMLHRFYRHPNPTVWDDIQWIFSCRGHQIKLKDLLHSKSLFYSVTALRSL